MSDFTILYDEPQEAEWFRGLHIDLADAKEGAITDAHFQPEVKSVLSYNRPDIVLLDGETPVLADAHFQPEVKSVLSYDRPDIVLLDGETPVLVVEETVEVPSGHNVGQRFARIAAAAEAGVPFLYFGPYVAKKHGGVTAGPRYMNVRLFHALDAMERITGTAVTTINWPVDARFEVRRDQAKDTDVREYLATFLALYANQSNMNQLNRDLLRSDIHQRMIIERNTFARTLIRNPEQYNAPPPSVNILSLSEFSKRHGGTDRTLKGFAEVVVYRIGMTSIRSDPYTGMSMLYRYLYILENPSRALVLWFPNITEKIWRTAAANMNRKDIRLFRIVADAILFSDNLVLREHL